VSIVVALLAFMMCGGVSTDSNQALSPINDKPSLKLMRLSGELLHSDHK
jgi:hypothetical protein